MDLNRNWLVETNLNLNKYKTLLLNDTIKDLKNDTENRSTSGLSEQYDIFDKFKEEPLQELKETITNHIKNVLTETKFIDVNAKLHLEASWIVVGKPNGYHKLHCHRYLQDPKTPNIASVIYLEMEPEEPMRAEDDRDGYFYYVVPDNNDIIYGAIKPEVNKMMVFPTWLWHGTYPQKKGRRTSLNLDFSIE
jgi:hypothetical protein